MKKKRILSLFLALILLMSSLSVLTLGASAEGGMTFTTDVWQMEEIPSVEALTYAAVLSVPSSFPDDERPGVIFGNYRGFNTGEYGVSFEIYENGNPRFLTYKAGDSKSKRNDLKFTTLDVRTDDGSDVYVAVTLDRAAGSATCHVVKNGVVTTETKTMNFEKYSISEALCVGGDPRSDDVGFFSGGVLKSVAMYSDVRSADEILAGATAAIDPEDTALLAGYDLSQTTATGCSDFSKNGNDLLFDAGVGVAFDETWGSDAKLTEAPHTFEAWIYMPTATNAGERGGVIYGNYLEKETECISFEIYENGNPRLYYAGEGTDERQSLIFDEVDVCTGGWVHLAIVADGTTFICYLNGEQAQTITNDYPISDTATSVTEFSIGGDFRTKKTTNDDFMGRIKEIAVYSDVRTADEIKSDMARVSADAEELLSYYDLRDAEEVGTYAKDLGSAGCDMYPRWMTESGMTMDYAYSFAVIGDTQKMTKYDAANGTEYLASVYTWLLENRDEKKIEYVMGLGDIVDTKTGNVSKAEWEWAYEQITRLDGNIAYSLVRGNHDNSALFNDTFGGHEPYLASIGGFYDTENKTLENTWRKITVSGVEYLIFTLDYGAKDDVLAWAGEIIEENPDSRVIITTHCYLYRDGTTLDKGDVVPPSNADPDNNNGDDMWDEFVSQYRNIFLVLSGHDPEDDVILTQTKGVHGNTVTQMLIDPQGMDSAYLGAGEVPTGMVCMLYFSEDGKEVGVEYYSTVREKFYKPDNQFTFTLVSDEGNGVVSIEKVSTDGLVDTYRVTYTNGTTQMIEVTNGADGEAGAPGASGAPGTDGENGLTPHVGENGNWWIGETDTGVKASGADGVTPTIGSNGNWWIGETDTGVRASGTDGVTPTIGENGNWWIGSIDTGVKASGANGAAGADGMNGTNGLTPAIGANGNWWIGDLDTGIKATGNDGKDGEDGADGKDGLTPHIGENGNWWIGDTDTGVKAAADSGCGSVVGTTGALLAMALILPATVVLKKKREG